MSGDDRAPGDEHHGPPTFATGGSFVVGNTGSRLAMFRVSPGDSIRVRTPEQVARVRRPWWRRLFARIRRAFTRRPS